jgi:hypothetical protein
LRSGRRVMGSLWCCSRWLVMASRSYTCGILRPPFTSLLTMPFARVGPQAGPVACPLDVMTGSRKTSCVMGQTRSWGVSKMGSDGGEALLLPSLGRKLKLEDLSVGGLRGLLMDMSLVHKGRSVSSIDITWC